MTTQAPIMLYDSDCALCTGAVQVVLDREKEPTLRFAPPQSDLGRAYLAGFGLEVDDFDSYVIVKEGIGSRKIKAAQRMGYHMGGLWRVLPSAPALFDDAN